MKLTYDSINIYVNNRPISKGFHDGIMFDSPFHGLQNLFYLELSS